MLMIDDFTLTQKDTAMQNKKKKVLLIATLNDFVMRYIEQLELFHYHVDIASTRQEALALKDNEYRMIFVRDYVEGLNGLLMLRLFKPAQKTYVLVENDAAHYKTLYQNILGLQIDDVFLLPFNAPHSKP